MKVDWTAIYPLWFGGGPEIDEEIVRRFSAAYSDAFAGKVSAWADTNRRAVSRILLPDRFPRNLFRCDERSFENDHLATLAGVMVKKDRTG